MYGAGILGQFGLRARSGWDQPYALPLMHLPFLRETLTANHERIEDESLGGGGAMLPSAQGNQVIQGETEHNMNYETLPELLASAMGILAVGPPGVIDIIDLLADSAWTTYWALTFPKGGVANHRFWPAMTHKFTLSGEHGGLLKLTVGWAARQFESAAFAAMTAPAADNKIKFDQGVFRVRDHGGAIGVGDSQNIDSFEVSFERGMKLDDYATHATLPQQPLEPLENAFRATALKITLPRYAADTFIGWRAANTPLQADLTFTGSGTKSLMVQLPELRITEGFDANVGGPDVLRLEGTMSAYRSSAGNPMYVGNEMKITYRIS